MVTLLLPLIAAQLVLWSDRADFWDADNISKQTEELYENGQIGPMPNFPEFMGKRVLMLIHGFNNSAGEALMTYELINEHFSHLQDESGRELYDVVIGYLWPGNDRRTDYFSAKRHAEKLASRMKETLAQLASQALKIDLFAHSMGNRLMLEALKLLPCHPDKKPIENFYSLAPAVDNEALERGEEYYSSTKQCENIFVFHSEEDNVLKYLYLTAERDRALGFKGEENSRYVPMNVQFIDCTAFVGGHSEYFHTSPLYQFIMNQHAMLVDPPMSAMHLKLLGDGSAKKT
jgi:esterase/lipase superfamily enzyme